MALALIFHGRCDFDRDEEGFEWICIYWMSVRRSTHSNRSRTGVCRRTAGVRACIGID